MITATAAVVVVVIAPWIEHPESWSMPAASEAIPIRVPAGAQRGEDGFVPCGVIDNDTLESVEDPPYFLDMSHYSQSVGDDDGPSAATIFAQRVSSTFLHIFLLISNSMLKATGSIKCDDVLWSSVTVVVFSLRIFLIHEIIGIPFMT